MAKGMVTCRYSHCLHGDNKILPKSEAHANGNAYYHQDCWECSRIILDIRNTFYEKVNNNVVVSQLMRTINNIIFDKGNDPKYVKFALDYAISHKDKIKLQYPGGLYYVIINKEIMDAWDKLNKPTVDRDSFIIEDDSQDSFLFIPKPMNNFADVLI